MQKAIILGAGNIGAYIASDLSKDYKVTTVDNSAENLSKISDKVTTIRADLSDQSFIHDIVKNYDIVVVALPESLGYDAVKSAAHAGKNSVDVSFWELFKNGTNRMDELNKIALKEGSTIIYDAGIAPGINNAEGAYLDMILEGKTKSLVTKVGSIPFDRKRGYFTGWSPNGSIEEYTRNVVYVKDGKIVEAPALSERKNIKISGIGELEEALTDGLRSLTYNLKHIPNKKELTLRHPGHYDQMVKLREMGYFSQNELSVNDNEITARQLSEILANGTKNAEETLNELGFFNDTTKYQTKNGIITPRKVALDVLSSTWKIKENDKDILVMNVIANNGDVEYTSQFYAKHDGKWSAIAMTTGGATSLTARMILNGEFSEKGAFPMEHLGKNMKLMSYFIKGLSKRGVTYDFSVDGI